MRRVLPTTAAQRTAVQGLDETHAAAARHAERRHRLRRTITGGALGGGVLLAGFGYVPAFVGAVIGGALGYLFERSVESNFTSQPA